MGQPTLRGALAALGIGITIAGVIGLPAPPGGARSDVLLIAAGIALFLWALRGRSLVSLAGSLERRPGIAIGALLAASALCSALAAVRAVQTLPVAGARYGLTIIFWISGLLAFVGAIAVGGDFFDDALSRLQAHWRYAVATLLLTLIAAFLRFYKLGSIPVVIDGDEGFLGITALQLQGSRLANPFASMDNVGGWYFRALAAAIDLFGTNPTALRVLCALGGTLAVPAVILLGQKLFGIRVAFLAGVLLAVSHAHIHFSRISSVLYILGTFFGTVVLYFLLTGLQECSWRRIGFSGLILGVYSCIYLDAYMIAGAMGIFVLAAFLFCRSMIPRAISLLPAFALGAAVASLPGLAWSAANPDTAVARFTVDGTFQSGWLEQAAEETGKSPVALLAGRFAHAFLALIYHPATDFYGSSSSLLRPVTASFFLLGLAMVTTRPREPSSLMAAVVFWSLTGMVGLFAVPPSADSYRMLVTLPMAMIITASGVDGLLRALGLDRADRVRALLGVSALALLPVIVSNLYAYFGRYAGRCLFWPDPNTRISSQLGQHLAGLPPDASVVLLADAHVRHGLNPSLDFLSGGRPITNWLEPAESLRPERNTVVVAPPSRVEELEDWARRHPGGSLVREYECRKLLFAAYLPRDL